MLSVYYQQITRFFIFDVKSGLNGCLFLPHLHMSKKSCNFVVHFTHSMNTLDDTLYYALQGLEARLAMQYNRHLGWSCRHIVRTGIEVAQTMLGDEDVEAHKESYYTFISRRMSSDPRETMMVIIVMQVLFRLIENDAQAQRCRNTFANDWCDEIEDMYHSYRRAVDEQIDSQLTKQPNHTFTVTVMRTEQPQTVINVAGNYIAEQHIDIHDNPYATIYATAQEPQPTPQAEEVQPIPVNHSCLFSKKAQREQKKDEIIEALQQSMNGRQDKARALVEEVRQWQKEGYLDSNYNARVMYDQLNRIITLPFQYGGFRKYYNE